MILFRSSLAMFVVAASFAWPGQVDLLAAQQAPSAAGSTDTPAARRFGEVLDLINHGDPATVTDWARQNVAPSRTAEWLATRIASLQNRSRGYDLVMYEFRRADAAGALVRNRLTGMIELLGVHVESTPPHRLVMLPRGDARLDPTATPASVLSHSEITQELGSYFQRLAEEGFLSGVILLAKDREPIFHQAYGFANRDFNVANRPDTKFNLGSMNKMFTAVAVAQLVEAGKLSFEDPLSKFLPEFPTPEAAQKIRIEHLLTHSSGLGSSHTGAAVRSRPRTVDESLALVRGDTLAFQPGTRYRYSNDGFLVLGKVIEVVTGMDYFDYVREHIYLPAEMHSTGSYELDRVNQNLAVGYTGHYLEDDVRYYNNIFHSGVRGGPAGGGYSTAEDLLRFAEALRAGRLVSPEMFRLMTSPKPEFGATRYGYGFLVETDGRRAVGHNGGWLGVYSKLDIYLDDGYTAVVLTNLNPGEPETTFEQKIRQLLPRRP